DRATQNSPPSRICQRRGKEARVAPVRTKRASSRRRLQFQVRVSQPAAPPGPARSASGALKHPYKIRSLDPRLLESSDFVISSTTAAFGNAARRRSIGIIEVADEHFIEGLVSESDGLIGVGV